MKWRLPKIWSKLYGFISRPGRTGALIDLIIMDLTIPGSMGGKEAVGKIHEIDPKAKVIVSSGYSNDPVMANYSEYGFCGATVKPFIMRELIELVGKAITG